MALTTLITAGRDRVYFAESGQYLMIVDPENNEGWYMHVSTPTTITKITSAGFPPNQTPALQLARGCVALNGTFYVMDVNGTIWNSAVDDPTTWSATDFIDAEIENDGGIGIAKHHTSLVAIGSKTIEFFQDVANPTGSPLKRRSDINYRVGGVKMDSFAQSQDVIFFIGVSEGGHASVKMLVDYSIRTISHNDLSALLSSAIFADNIKIVAAAFSTGNSTDLAITTLYDDGVNYVPLQTFVWQSEYDFWSVWKFAHTGYTTAPIVSWASGKATISNAGQGMTILGDIMTIADDFNPQDLTLAQIYVAPGYVEPGYISDTGQSGNVIHFEYQFGRRDFGTRARKRHHSLRINCDEISSGTVTIAWADDQNKTFNTGRSIDPTQISSKIRRLGMSRQRNYKLTHDLSDQFRISGIELEITGARD